MHFSMKSYLKSNRNHTAKQERSIDDIFFQKQRNSIMRIFESVIVVFKVFFI
jgi:NADPH-dependent 7-cyano-7-deazaguanine reductase QueF